MLKFGASNNWLQFKSRLSTTCLEKYGDLGRLIETEDYYEPPEVNPNDYEGWETDDIQKMLYMGEVKARAKKVRQMREDRSKMYAYVLSKLSKESLDEFKHHEDYALVHDNLSLKGLWIVLREVHAANNSSTNLLILKHEAFQSYAKCKQGEFETLANFRLRFEFDYENYLTQGNDAKSQEDMAMDFMYALHGGRYGGFVAEIINDVAKGAINQPKDVNAVFLLANTRVVVSKSGSQNQGATFATIEQDAKWSRGAATRAARNKTSGKKKEPTVDVNSGNKQSGSGNSDAGSDKAEKKKAKRKARRARKIQEQIAESNCHICGEKGHWKNQCPRLNEDADEDVAFMTLSQPSKEAFYGYEVVLDNGSQVNIMHPRFLSNIRAEQTSFKGLDSKSKSSSPNMVGDLHGFFKCIASRDIRISVLSQDDVETLSWLFGASRCVREPCGRRLFRIFRLPRPINQSFINFTLRSFAAFETPS